MSKEWSYFDIECNACGNKGEASMWSDDWNRWDGNLTGFDGSLRISSRSKYALSCCSQPLNRELFSDDVVGPLNQRHKYCRVTELCPVIAQVRFGHASGARARPTSVDLNMLSGELI
jgi:hypothetical protein